MPFNAKTGTVMPYKKGKTMKKGVMPKKVGQRKGGRKK